MINLCDISTVPIIILLDAHYNYLNPVDATGKLLATSLIQKLISLQEELEYSEIDYTLENEILEFLIGDDLIMINNIITGNPEILENIIDELEANFDTSLISNQNGEAATLTFFGNKLKSVFDYESYRNSDACFSMLGALKFRGRSRPCPYCNIESIEVINKRVDLTAEEVEQALLDIDHFYPRSRFPFLAVSFFNLIPSCSKCNRNLKKQKDFRDSSHINPYSRAFDDHFRFYATSVIFPDQQVPSFEIDKNSIIIGGTSFSESSITDLRLIQRIRTKPHLVQRFFRVVNRFNGGVNNANILFDSVGAARLTLEDAIGDFGVSPDPLDIHDVELAKVLRDLYYC